MTANDSKSYLSYLNKLVDQSNNTYHHSISKKPINTNYSAVTEKTETNSKSPNLNLMIEWELIGTRIFLVKITVKMVKKNI